MLDKKGNLRCDWCHQVIDKLTEEQALGDLNLVGCGWSDWKTAYNHACSFCAVRLHESAIPYETYIAGRIKLEDNEIRVYEPSPFRKGGCYHVKAKINEEDSE